MARSDKKDSDVPAKREETAVARVPVKAQGPARDPFAKQDQPQVTLPRIVLLQPLSAEVVREEDKKTVGKFLNRLSGEELGSKIQFVPFEHTMTRIRMEQGSGLQCRSIDMYTAQMMGGRTSDKKPTNNCEVCVYRLWPEERMALTGEDLQGRDLTGGPACSVVDNFLAIQVGREDGRHPWILLQFMRTSAKAARDIKGMWLDSEQPLEHFVYADYATPVKGANNYFKQDVARVRPSNDEERAAIAALRERLGKVVIEDVSAEESSGGQVDPAKAEATAKAKGF